MTAIFTRQCVPPGLSYRDYREYLREDFWYACAYCSTTEVEACAIGFQIEHYEPQAACPHLIDQYDNLMWCCQHCNELKSDIYPPPKARAIGQRFLRPDIDNPEDHISSVEVRVEPLTETGRFSIELLDLNRQSLRRLREIRKRLHDSRQHVLLGLVGLKSMSLDRLPREVRAKFVSIKAQLLARNETALEATEAALIALAIRSSQRSPFIDVDSEKPKRAKERAKSLEKLKAVHASSFRQRKPRRT